MNQGERVPQEVLDDYPDLRERRDSSRQSAGDSDFQETDPEEDEATNSDNARTDDKERVTGKNLWAQVQQFFPLSVHKAGRKAAAGYKLANLPPQAQELLHWAADLESEKQQLQAKIELSGGQAEVWVLCDLHGNEVSAGVRNGPYSAYWQILDACGRPTGERVPYRPASEATLRKQGYTERWCKRPAKAMIVFGRSGAVWPRAEAVIDQ
jgi:hypothetical protein